MDTLSPSGANDWTPADGCDSRQESLAADATFCGGPERTRPALIGANSGQDAHGSAKPDVARLEAENARLRALLRDCADQIGTVSAMFADQHWNLSCSALLAKIKEALTANPEPEAAK